MRTKILALLSLALLAGCAKVANVIPFVDAPEPDPGLAGTQWQVVELEGGWDAPAYRLGLAFDRQGRVGGFGGCHALSARYEEPEPGRLRIDGLDDSDNGACSDEAIAIDQALRDALPRVVRYRGKPDARELLDGSGRRLIRLAPANTGG